MSRGVGSALVETSRDMAVGCDRDEGSGYGVDCDCETGCSDRGREDKSRCGECSGRIEERCDHHVLGHGSDGRYSDGCLRGGKGEVSESGVEG